MTKLAPALALTKSCTRIGMTCVQSRWRALESTRMIGGMYQIKVLQRFDMHQETKGIEAHIICGFWLCKEDWWLKEHFIWTTHTWWYIGELGVSDTTCGDVVEYGGWIHTKSGKRSMWEQIYYDVIGQSHEIPKGRVIGWACLWRQFGSNLLREESTCWSKDKTDWCQSTLHSRMWRSRLFEGSVHTTRADIFDKNCPKKCIQSMLWE